MFDLHSHVLPGIDDGAKSVEMSLEMLRTSAEQGVELVVATPHCVVRKEDSIANFIEKRKNAYDILMAEVNKNKDKYPKVLLGAEVYLGNDISEYSDIDKLCYDNTDYILLELAEGISPSVLAEWVYNINIRGLRPIIAHVDRYVKYKEIMDEFAHLDLVYQINATRFYTLMGRSMLKSIFKRHNKFYVSSDMHNVTTRPCNMGGAKAIADKKFPHLSKMLFEDGAKSVLLRKKLNSFT